LAERQGLLEAAQGGVVKRVMGREAFEMGAAWPQASLGV